MATLNEWKRKEKFREEEGGGFLLYRGGWDCVGKAGCFSHSIPLLGDHLSHAA
jgi:hypothetical protein